MKKIASQSARKLVVGREVVRQLSALDVRAVKGGWIPSDGGNCTTLAEECPGHTQVSCWFC